MDKLGHTKFLHFFNDCSLLILFSKFSLYIVSLIDVFQRTSRNCRKLFGLITCGRGFARVSATLEIDVRERFVSAACRLKKVLDVVLGVQCRLGEGRALQVVLRVVVDWK